MPEIGTPGSESGGRKRAYGLRTAARLRKRRTSHRVPTGYAPPLDSTRIVSVPWERTVSLVFYAGHTTSRWTASTTVPVDARLERDVDVRFETVTPDDLLVRRQGRRCGWSSLDACRNNPLARSMRAPPATRTVSGGQLRGTGRGPPGGRAAGPDEGLHRSRSATPATDSAPSFPAPARSCRGRVPVGKPSPVPAPIPHRVAAARSGRPRSAVAGHRHRLPR